MFLFQNRVTQRLLLLLLHSLRFTTRKNVSVALSKCAGSRRIFPSTLESLLTLCCQTFLHLLIIRNMSLLSPKTELLTLHLQYVHLQFPKFPTNSFGLWKTASHVFQYLPKVSQGSQKVQRITRKFLKKT